MIRASAPAKAMLFGEYAVLEGHPAVAVALDARITVRASRTDLAGLCLRSPIWPRTLHVGASQLRETWPPHPELNLLWPLLQGYGARALAGARTGTAGGTALLDGPGHGHGTLGLDLAFDEGFPTKWGLGSSSASTLAALAALRALAGVPDDVAGIFAEARGAQRRIQGAASGYDVATQLLGGGVALRDDGGRTALDPIFVPEAVRAALHIVWTGKKVATSAMVRDVRGRHPQGSPIYGRIGRLAEAAIPLIERGDVRGLGDALRDGDALMRELGTVPRALEDKLATVHGRKGILGARLSGAGGGDCIVVLSVDADLVARCAVEFGWTALPLRVSDEGLRVEWDR